MADKLQKLLAQAGLGSRREIEKWIEARRVSVNGAIATLGDRATIKDVIRVDGRVVKFLQAKYNKPRIIVYYKPEGEVCTQQDPQGRPTVFARLPRLYRSRWVMISRLDINTSGLLLFTNQGELANQLMHPRYQIEREYAVRVLGTVDDTVLETLQTNVVLDDGPAHFDKITFSGGEGANRWYHVTLHSGRHRLVRRLWESQNLMVSRLMRIRYGTVSLPRFLKAGKWYELPEQKIQALLTLVEDGKNR